MEIRFYIDRDTGAAHIENHGVSEDEVRDVVWQPLERFAGSGGTTILHGQTRAGRYLKVIVAFDEDGKGVFVITAYDITPNQLRALRRRLRRKQR